MVTGGAGGEVDLGSAVLRLYGDRSALDKELEKLRRYTDLLEKQGIQVKFDANTGDATREVDEFKRGLIDLQKVIDAVQRAMQLDGQAWQGLAEGLQRATEGAESGTGALAGMAGGLGRVAGGAARVIPILGQIGLAAMGLQAIFEGVTSAVRAVIAPFQQLSRQTGEFNKQVAEASIFTAQAFAVIGPDGKAIDGTANQMRALRGRITDEFKAIQKEVAQISGATSSQVYQAFNIISQNNSGLGRAGEDLGNVTRLSTRIAAAMNTLNIPGEQLMPETMSLLTGQVQVYDQLATKIYGQGAGGRIRQLQAEGKFYDDLMQRLGKLYDGQKVLATSLENIQSNYQDVFESINAAGGVAFERGLGRAFQAVLTPLTQLKDAFADMMRSVGEAIEPYTALSGLLASAVVPIFSVLASVLQAVGDVLALAGNLVNSVLLPGLQILVGILTVVAKGVQLLAALISAVLRPISVFFRILGQTNRASAAEPFDAINNVLDGLIEKADRLAAVISRPFVAAAQAAAWLQGKALGKSDREIATRQADIAADFAGSVGTTDQVSLRSINVSPLAQQMEQEARDRYAGAIPEEKQLGKTREIADLKQRMYQNEVTALEQSLQLLNAQRGVQQALFDLAESKRGIEAKRAEFSVSLAASPEARLQAEDRRNELAAQQEQQRIRERVSALQTERQIQQQQLEISIRQAAIQQEQLKIQKAEIRVQQIKTRLAAEEFYRKSRNAAPGSPEQRSLQDSFLRHVEILGVISQQLAAADRAVSLSFQGAANLRRVNSLEQERLDLQQQSLGAQSESANLTAEQQRILSRLKQREQEIKNELDARTNVEKDLNRGRQQEIAVLQRQLDMQQRLEALERSRAELAKARADAGVKEAERGLALAKAQAGARNNPTSVEAVIGAQIEALALGRRGFVSEAEATRALYQQKAAQLNQEQTLARQQQKLQQDREASEQRIALLQLQVQRSNMAIQLMQLEATRQQLKLQQERDRMSGATGGAAPGTLPGAPSAPVLPPPAGAGSGGGTLRGGARTGRSRDPDGEATGWDIVVPGGRGGAVQNPFGKLTITGTGFQGSGSGSSGRGYGNWVTGEFDLNGKKYEVLLGHFDRVDVSQGMVLGPGDRIGTQGITGRTFGAHVTTHVNPKGRASVADAWGALEALTRAWETGAVVSGSGSAPSASGTGSPVSLDNSLQENASAIEDAKKSMEDLRQALKDLMTVFGPALQERQANERESLRITQAEQGRAAQAEERRALLRAQIMESPRGRMAGELTEATVGGFGGALRAGLSEVIRGGDVRSAMSQALLTASERTAQIALDAVLKPLERMLTETLFKGLSGANYAELQAASGQQAAASTQARAAMVFDQAVSRFATLPFGNGGGGFSVGSLFGGGGGSIVESIFSGAGPAAGLAAPTSTFAQALSMPLLAGFSQGGVASGSPAGYPVMLHGTEAVIPMPGGRSLPVELQGGKGAFSGGLPPIQVTVDAKGTAVAGNDDKGNRLGQLIGDGVMAILIREKRPGGVLYD